MKKNETFETTLDGGVNGIVIETACSDTTIKTAETNEVRISYVCGGDGRNLNGTVDNGTLNIHETIRPLSLNVNPSTLEITLPAKKYDSFTLKFATGKNTVNEIICGKFSLRCASGRADIHIFAEESEIHALSGKCDIYNCTENKARMIKIDSGAGNHTLHGFMTESFFINAASGSINAEKISGSGNIKIASGNINLSYAQWDGDISIDAASGKVELKLPENCGANLDLKAASGSVVSRLGGTEATLSGNSSCTVGSDNIHNVNVKLASGKITLCN